MLFLHKPPPRTTPPRIANLGARLDSHLKTWGALGVAIFAMIYYAAYYRSGLNFSGEGGTVAIIAMRLLDGQRPIVDTFLGYNVMWFYPVAWLFQVTGPDYTALRIFFFALCTVTGILAFFVVRRVTGSGWKVCFPLDRSNSIMPLPGNFAAFSAAISPQGLLLV